MSNLIADWKELKLVRENLRQKGKKVVFSNGCFDIMHSGHVDYLAKARSFGDALIVAVNSDSSIKRIKGEKRPILDQEERALIVGNLKSVDFVTFFDDDTPENIIRELVPDILVKGEDWALDKIVGRNIVEGAGGKVERIKFVSSQSTSKIISTILERYKE